MSDFIDCEYRFVENDVLYCKNKENRGKCDNCLENVHLNCSNYNPKHDMCLKWFETDISSLKECKEKSVFSDKDLSRKWSN